MKLEIYFTILLILLGSLILLLSIFGTVKIVELKLKKRYKRNWRVLIALISFFIFGYLVTAILVYVGKRELLILLTGIVFFFGALFVLIVVRLGYFSLKDLSNQTEKAQESTRKLEVKNKELEQFAYITSHDLQEPLRNLQGLINLLKFEIPKPYSENLDAYFGMIHKSLLRMTEMIKVLLDFSKGNEKIKIEEYDANEIVFDVLADLQLLIQESNSNITKEELPSIKCNYVHTKQLFQNLISNAIKFRNPNRKCEIWIKSKIKKNMVHFSIKDNGLGIAPENIKSIFQIFNRGGKDMQIEGNGIGLAHCKKIVEAHGGKIWVESSPGLGSNFKFQIPRV